jgi:hypothetical protein
MMDLSKIDEEMRAVVKELNAVGLVTAGCCSGHGRRKRHIIFDLGKIKDSCVIFCHDRLLQIDWNVE